MYVYHDAQEGCLEQVKTLSVNCIKKVSDNQMRYLNSIGYRLNNLHA